MKFPFKETKQVKFKLWFEIQGNFSGQLTA